MACNFEPVPVTSQKHDPAWKHCQMFKNGDRVQLKCLYCGKIFKGGGIHRIKEHLAGQKGNASTCLRVQPDVRLLMQESLNGVMAKKRKKKRLDDEMSSYDADTGALVNNSCGLNTAVDLLPVPDAFEQNSHMFLHRSEGVDNRFDGRKKKGRIRKGPAVPANTSAIVASDSAALPIRRANNTVHMAIGRFFFDVGIPFDAVNSSYFQPMIDAIAARGAESVGPSYHDIRSEILMSSVREVRKGNEEISDFWGQSGCSVLVEEWITEKGKALINFLIYNAKGTTFLRSLDISNFRDSTDAIYELLKEVVEEVGARNVLQLVTNGDERYVLAGKRLSVTYPTVFWTPCAVHRVELMLEDIRKLDWVDSVLEQAKSIARYVYNHSAVLNMMRRYTFNVDLVDPGSTHSETDFLTLKRIINIRHNLQSMVTSEEWMESTYSKRAEGLTMLDYISNQAFWSSCGLVARITDPLLRLLRIISNGKRPAMGYVYAALYRAKETIKKELIDRNYREYWNIIDHRWGKLRDHPLLAAGFYLNPKFFYSITEDVRLLLRSRVYDCIEKLVPDPHVQDKIVKEIPSYHSAAGDFGRKMAIRARDNLLPSEWWETYGGGCPDLARLAIRILSQTCSLVRCKPSQVLMEQMHDTKNCLEHQRLSDLVFVQYNMWLRQMVQRDKEKNFVDPLSFGNSCVVEDWVTEKDICSNDLSSSDWMNVEVPSDNTLLLGPPVDDVEALGAGFNDYEIFDWAKGGEEETGEDNAVS